MRSKPNLSVIVFILTLISTHLSAQEFWITSGNQNPLITDCGTITDEEGNIYNTVIIGDQCWTLENLNTGDRIDGGINQTDNNNIEKYCYGDLESNCDIYGGLYQWHEIMDYSTQEGAQGVCPDGWHIPNDAEWWALKSSMGIPAGGELKSSGTVGAATGLWQDPNTSGTNSSGFTGLCGGLLDMSSVSYYLLGYSGYYWSSTERDTYYAWVRRLSFIDDLAARLFYNKTRGLSVRCLKDFECGDVITDPRDWKPYETVEIEGQCWMEESLNIGDRVDDTEDQTDNGTIEKYCYNNLESNCDIYGGLYQWDEMMDYGDQEGAQGICPFGWHIPTNADWIALTDTLGGVSVAGGKLKSTGTVEDGTGLWYFPNLGATNSSGFTGLPGGNRFFGGGSFGGIGRNVHFWASNESSSAGANWGLLYNYEAVFQRFYEKTYGYSVRCMKD